jgi:proline racemase
VETAHVVTHLVKAIDAHVGGQPLRLVVDGVPTPAGVTLAQRVEWMRRHADYVRKAMVLPPRGHADMVAAQLLEPRAPGVDAAILFMDSDGYRAMSGHGIIAATTIAVERDLAFNAASGHRDTQPLVFETAAGVVHVRARLAHGRQKTRVDTVTITNVPAFVYMPGHIVRLGARELRVDVAFGGVFHAIVDTESVGIPLTVSRVGELRRLAIDLTDAVNESLTITHPLLGDSGIAGVVFTGPPHDPESHLRAVSVSGGGAVNWSPGGTAMSAIMSVLDAMQLLSDEATFVQEGLFGTMFHGRIVGRSIVGDWPAVVTEIEGSAWITGEHTFVLDDDDPFKEGVSQP